MSVFISHVHVVNLLLVGSTGNEQGDRSRESCVHSLNGRPSSRLTRLYCTVLRLERFNRKPESRSSIHLLFLFCVTFLPLFVSFLSLSVLVVAVVAAAGANDQRGLNTMCRCLLTSSLRLVDNSVGRCCNKLKNKK